MVLSHRGVVAAADAVAAKREIDQLVAAFFRLFRNDLGRPVDLSPIYDLFIPSGVVIKNLGGDPEVYDLAGFIAPRAALLNGGRLTGFWEREVAERTDIFGSIAQRFSHYRKGGVLDGVAFEADGMKTTQFVRTPQGWRMSSLAWDDCREGLMTPREFAGG